MSEARRFVGIDHAPVEEWLTANVDDMVAPLRFSVISGGHSNITYFVTDAAGRTVVLRRPPLATKSSNAHNMGREFTVIRALVDSAVPVPTALALCEDEVVNGSPFYVMTRVEGQVIENPERVEEFLPSQAARTRASHEIVDVLAAMHLVDIDEVGLGGMARREGFLDRQLKRIGEVWEQSKTRDLPLMDELRTRLVARRPAQRYTGIVHSDYRMGNVMFDTERSTDGCPRLGTLDPR